MGSMNLKVNEPSMEDILASIRRIISDDQEPVHEPAFREPESSPLKTVLDIAERHVASDLCLETREAEEEVLLSRDDPFKDEQSIVHFTQDYEALRPAPRAATAKAPAAQPCENSPGEALLSRMAEASVCETFGRLNAIRAPSQSPTVEDLMKEMLRPMLKAWLDDNLPALVERLVQAEIERVTRG
jgi:cell pole-organizing protein PopZ